VDAVTLQFQGHVTQKLGKIAKTDQI